MHIAWSPNDWTNFGPIAWRSLSDATQVVTAAWSGSRRYETDRSFGIPSFIAAMSASIFDLSTTMPAPASTVSWGGVHCALIDALTCAAAAHWPLAPPPPLPAAAAPEQPPLALADALASTVHLPGV